MSLEPGTYTFDYIKHDGTVAPMQFTVKPIDHMAEAKAINATLCEMVESSENQPGPEFQERFIILHDMFMEHIKAAAKEADGA